MHIIQKQIIELTLGRSKDHFQVQQKISDHYFRYFIPILDSEFERISTGDSVLVIDRLEIDLGQISEKSILQSGLNDEFLKHVAQAINLQLSEFIFSSKPQSAEIPARENNFRQWMFYMQFGYLPWNSLVPDDNWHTNILEAVATDFSCAAWLSSEILKNSVLVLRIIRQHSSKFLVSLTETLTARNQSSLLQMLNGIKVLLKYFAAHYNEFEDTKNKFEIRLLSEDEELWKRVLWQSAVPGLNKTTVQLSAGILKELMPVEKISLNEISGLGNDVRLLLPVIELLQKEFKGVIKSDELSKKSPAGNKKLEDTSEEQKGKQDNNTKIDRNSQIVENITGSEREQEIEKVPFQKDEERTAETTNQSRNEPTDDLNTDSISIERLQEDVIEYQPVIGRQNVPKDGIFVQYAGLVLLHPFISYLFKHTGLVAGKQFISESAHQKAIYLLHYISSGERTAEEYELVIPKVLCGYEIGKPVSKSIVPDNLEISEADDMIRAAISQWDILKKTSPDGLREGFLRRNGKIYTKNENIYIHVEKSAIDILLDKLPWGLSMIKLPWLNEIIRVEWR